MGFFCFLFYFPFLFPHNFMSNQQFNKQVYEIVIESIYLNAERAMFTERQATSQTIRKVLMWIKWETFSNHLVKIRSNWASKLERLRSVKCYLVRLLVDLPGMAGSPPLPISRAAMLNKTFLMLVTLIFIQCSILQLRPPFSLDASWHTVVSLIRERRQLISETNCAS